MVSLFEKIGLYYLQQKKQRVMRNVDVNKPIELLAKFKSEFTPGSPSSENLIQNILQHIGVSGKGGQRLVQTEEYASFKTNLDEKLAVFEKKPYQLGALDEEIHIITELLYHCNKPSVLEIGVANGYSSAFLYFALKNNGGVITSIDLPRFSRRPILPSDMLRAWLAKRGKITNTGTLGDLNPGGVIPKERYGGWLVPFRLRQSVPNITINGNAFNIVEDFPADLKFDFVVVDAMKGYDERMKMLTLVSNYMKPNGLCALDGYWVNPAFDNFCRQYKKPSWKFGRVGLFANN